MAQLRKPIHDDGPVNAGEQRLLDFLCVKLARQLYGHSESQYPDNRSQPSYEILGV